MRGAILAIAVAATVAACGSGTKLGTTATVAPGSSIKASTPHTKTKARHAARRTRSSPTPAYPAAARKAITATCRRQGTRSQCRCVVTFLEDNIPYARLKGASIGQLYRWEINAATNCAPL